MGTYTETANYALRKPDTGGVNWDVHINYDLDQIDQILSQKSDITHNHDSEYVKLTDYEDADVLAKLLNVDGDGSSLDADKVDGLEASQFVRNDTDGAITGNITITGGLAATTITYTKNTNSTSTIDFTTGQYQYIQITTDTTLAFSAPGGVGRFVLEIEQDATGHAVTFPSTDVVWLTGGGNPPDVSTPSTHYMIDIIYNGATYICSYLGSF